MKKLGFTAALTLTLAAAPALMAQEQPKDIVDTAVAAGSFKTLATALKAAGLIEALKGPGPFTVFAPTDEAFAALPKGTVEGLLEPGSAARLKAVLTYHVVPGRLVAKDVLGREWLTTLQGQRADVRLLDGHPSIDQARIVTTDIACANGVIHVIDRVILPAADGVLETAQAAGFKTLLAAIDAAGLREALGGDGPFTVFAPTDAAFAALPKGTLESLLQPANKAKLQAILKLHVVSGGVYSDQAAAAGKAPSLLGEQLTFTASDQGLTVNGAAIGKADVEARNGVIHVIDRVLLPAQK
jgi:uncharacterized surface protein with fasciclin (FAS1) repeats